MKRGSQPGRQALLWIISLLVVASMICSFITYLRPPRLEPTPAPESASTVQSVVESLPTDASSATATPAPETTQ